MAATVDPWGSLTNVRKNMAAAHKKWVHDIISSDLKTNPEKDKNGCYKY